MNSAAHRAFTFAARGGAPPLTWAVASGPGVVSSTGTFTADGHTGATKLTVTDRRKTTATVTVMNGYALTDGTVRAAVEAPGALYLGGDFGSLYPDISPGLVALDPASGTAQLDFDIGSGFNGEVVAMAASATSLYVGGSFTTYRGQAAPYIAKLDLQTGALDTDFYAGIGGGAYPEVDALLVADNAIYIGGSFSICKTAAQSLCKVDLATGKRDDTFTLAQGVGGTVHAFVPTAAGLFIAGEFTTYRGTTASGLVKVDTTSGALVDGFTIPVLTPSGYVFGAVTDGTWIYIVGFMTQFGPTAVQYLARLNPETGAVDAPFAAAGGFSSATETIAIDATGIYVGGIFSSYRGHDAQGFAKVDLDGTFDALFNQDSFTTGAETTRVWAANGAVYLRGRFSRYRSDALPGSAKVSPLDGALDHAFHAGLGPARLGAVTAVGSRLFASCNLGVGGVPANGLARLDTPSLAVNVGFSNQLPAFSKVLSLVMQGGALYVGHDYPQGNQGQVSGVTKLSPVDGVIDATFTGVASVGQGEVHALAATSDALYLGGDFQSYAGVATTAIAKANLTTGVADATFFKIATGAFNGTGGAIVNALAINGTSLYVGGTFSTYRTAAANALIKLDLTSGDADAGFTASGGFSGINTVNDLAIVPSLGLFAVGKFSTYRALPEVSNIVVSLSDGSIVSSTHGSGADAQVRSVWASSSAVYIGGDFSHYQFASAGHLAKIAPADRSPDEIFALPGGCDGDIYRVTLTQEGLLVGGGGPTCAGIPVAGAFFLDPTSGKLP